MGSIVSERDVVGRACCVAATIAFGLLALALGQDANWDLQNYHWYNAYAFLTGRGDLDLAPAQTPTFYNPLLDVPFFVLAQHAPAWLCTFVLALAHGFDFVLLYALSRVLVPQWSRIARGGGGALIAALGVAGGGVFGLLGTTFYDNALSLFLLSALWLVCRALAGGVIDLRTLAAAGLLAGAGVGLKLPTATYALGLSIAVFALPGSVATRLKRTTTFGLAGLVGVLAFGGFWMLHLWRHFGNPVFPYFNDVIGSSMALKENYRDTRFIPTSLLDALALPFRSAFNPYLVGEVDFTDYRILLLIVAALVTGAFAALRRTKKAGPDAAPSAPMLAPALRFAFIAAAAAYAAWLAVFAIYRYLVALELLAPVLAAALIAAWPIRPRTRVAIGLACALLLAVTTRTSYWNRVPFGARFVEVTAPQMDPNPMVLMAGYGPLAWVIPSFPAGVPFVRLHGYGNELRDADSGLARIARTRVANHSGSFYLLFEADDVALVDEVLARFDLAANLAACEPIDGNLNGGLRFCPVHRTSTSP